jgi:hypothetical protein
MMNEAEITAEVERFKEQFKELRKKGGTIGNMGRVIFVFEVQTKGSIDSLILNLLKSLNNSSVQGVVAVSDINQLEKIQKYASDVKDLKDKLRYWDYEEVLKVHESLEFINESINNLGLVPQGF